MAIQILGATKEYIIKPVLLFPYRHDYNALYNKKHGHMILVGLRYAATSFKYDVEALGISDPEYGEVG